jgi:hypothetical protein
MSRNEEVRSRRVLMVSKPVHAPFHDGSQVLVRELANHMAAFTPLVMGTGQRHGFAAHVVVERTYARHGGFAPQLQQNVRPLWRLIAGVDADLWHFVFAPNSRSCRVIRALRQFKSRPTVQTIASPPRSFESIDELLFGEAVVAQSQWTADQVRQNTASRRVVEVIRPPVGPVPVPAPGLCASLRRELDIAEDHEVITYPGDLEFSGGAQRVASLVKPLVEAHPRALVVFACRQKTAAAASVLQALQAQLNPAQVRFAGELPSLPVLLASSKLVLFPVAELFAKVDIPIALLEAMSLGVPLVVPTEGPVAELTSARRVPLQDNAAWVRACSELLLQVPMWEMIRTRQRVQLESEFAAKVVAARYEDLYQRVLGKSEPRPTG